MTFSLQRSRTSVAIGCAMLIAAALALILAPRTAADPPAPPLAALVPAAFGAWRALDDSAGQVALSSRDEDAEQATAAAYDDALLRTYVRADGARMMVAFAYDKTQREENRVHRPEICYRAQGFRIIADVPARFSGQSAEGTPIEGRRMLTQNGARIEAVSYWIRIGDSFTQNPWMSRFYVVQQGLRGRLRDGILVRVSEIIPATSEADRSFHAQDEFITELIKALPPEGAWLVAHA